MASIKEVAQMAGVSISTVSRVLNSNAPVNEKTKAAVLGAMETLDYIPDNVAQGMRTRRSNTIGMIIPEYMNAFYHELLHYIEEQAGMKGYKVLVTSIREKEGMDISHIRDLLSRRMDGIIICTYQGDETLMSYLLKVDKKIPIVFLDNLGEAYNVNAVYTDGYEALREMTAHLQELGHERIAFIGGLKQFHVANDRLIGYQDAMKAKGLAIQSSFIYEGDYSIESGYAAGRFFMEARLDCPTAIAAASDLMALGAMNYCLSHGLRIPEDIAVAGFDDILSGRLMVPALSTVTQPMAEIAQKAINLVIHRILHPKAKPRKIVIKGALKVRGSSDVRQPKAMRIVM